MLLTRNRGQVDLRWVVLRVVLEFLQLFRVVFNTTFAAWAIDTKSPAFQAIRWVLIRGLVMHHSYDQYIKVFYAISAIILISLAMAVWLAVMLKKDDAAETGWLGKCARAQLAARCRRRPPDAAAARLLLPLPEPPLNARPPNSSPLCLSRSPPQGHRRAADALLHHLQPLLGHDPRLHRVP